MSPPTDLEATANHRNRTAPTSAAKPSPGPPAAADGKKAKPPKLTGIMTIIKPLVASQPDDIQTTMVTTATTMLKTERDIRHRLETRRRLEGTYEDKNDVDPATGKGRQKPFIPGNIRKATMPLNFSDNVQNDSRCAEAFSEITTTMETARIYHEEWKQKMAILAKEIAASELKARMQFQFSEYCSANIDLAEGFLEVSMHELDAAPTALTKNEVVHAAIKAAMEESYDATHWENLRFTASSDKEVINKFYKKFQQRTGINFDATIQPKLNAMESESDESGVLHADWAFICAVQQNLEDAIPALTTNLWKSDKDADSKKKLDAKLKALYDSKKIKKANQDLGDAMDTDGGRNMESFVAKTVDKEVDRRIANKKKEIRKNSSGAPKNQGQTPTKHGQKPRGNSERKPPRSRSQSQKRHYEDNGYNNNNDQYYNNNNNNQRRRNDDYYHQEDKERGRQHYRQPSILRNRSISWGRSRTPPPPRSRYSRKDQDHRPQGASYHGTRDTGRGRGRGRGRRGGSSRGRGGRSGRGR